MIRRLIRWWRAVQDRNELDQLTRREWRCIP